ncbi:hypothetical protein [Phytohabitans rumicis]|uniref:Uncharacterized protein n=1 Tax=Phytohabitans rumicis TaxID=1076125 RepID=A0A6V8L8R1_9ACTN|nr:hypothetical protein [Phytohabitans rumicis]GFJ93633.1 hypothetical protein Prum_072750 [Phytohabitans rumicis]
MINAFAATHGMDVATNGTAALQASPTPPPNKTNLAKEPNALRPTGRASPQTGAAVSNLCIMLSIGRS